MSNRFHNKLHRINHHSQRTPKNDTYTDASYDPIASYEAPFQGEFYSDGELVTHTYLSAASAIFTNDGTIFNDLFVGNNVTINNGLSVETDLLVKGNFTVLGSTSQIDTLVYVTSAMSITNVGTGPALLVNQTGNNIVADFRDDGVSSLFIDGRTATAGFIGINTSSPNERLTVVGNISARGNLIVTQNVSISGNQAVLGSVFVSGSQFIEDDLTVYRNTFLETLTAESPTFESYVATLGLSGAALDPNPFLFLGRMGINGLPKDTNSLHIQGGNLRIDGADYSTKDYSYLGGISALDTDGTALLDLRSSDVNQKYTLSIAESGVQNFLKISGGTLSNPQPKIVVKEGVPLLFGTHSSFFDDSFIEKVRIDSNGNVGIGESSPQQKLTVKGNVSAAGDGIFTGNFYVSGDQVIERDLEVRGGDLTTDQSTFNLINTNASTVNFAGASTVLNVGALNSWTNLRGNLSANGDGIFTKNVYVSADVFVGGEDLISTTSTFNLINTNASTVNFAGAANTLNVGALNSWTNLRGNLSANGDGIFTKNVYVSGDQVIERDLEVRGGDLTTDQSTFNLINANASTINFAGASTVLSIGSSSGFTNINNNLNVSNVLSADGDGIFTKNLYLSGNEIVQGTITAKTLNVGSTDDIVIKSSTNVLETREINNRVWNTTANLLSGALTQNYLPKFESGSSLVNSIVFDDGTFVGINTITPTATLDVSGSFKSLSANVTELFAVPVGTIAQRVSAQGAIRYNTEANTFEGYSGIEWGPIGGGALIDANKDTYITVDEDPPTNTDQITFYTANTAMMIILSSGNVGIGELNPQEKLTVNGSISASNTVYISAVEFTGITTTATSITADNLFIQVNIGGVQKYLRLFDIE